MFGFREFCLEMRQTSLRFQSNWLTEKASYSLTSVFVHKGHVHFGISFWNRQDIEELKTFAKGQASENKDVVIYELNVFAFKAPCKEPVLSV